MNAASKRVFAQMTFNKAQHLLLNIPFMAVFAVFV
jgi:hypothetical protein